MYCENCGSKILEDAAFCTGCGKKLNESTKKEKTTKVVEDNVVKLQVKPKFKFWYLVFPYIGLFVFLGMIFGMFGIAFSVATHSIISLGNIVLFIVLGVCLVIGIIMLFTKKQYDSYNYEFYNTKVIYQDSFINISEKEVKYKHIIEVTLTRRLFQRMFNLGTIVLYTNAETGYMGGTVIKDVENPTEIYNQIKELINND